MTEKDDIVQEVAYCIQSKGSIPYAKVYQWMKNKDLDIMGIVSELLMYSENVIRMDIEIEQSELEEYLFQYYERCLYENPKDHDWAHSRYEVCRCIAEWFIAIPEDMDLDTNTFIVNIKNWMKGVYLKSDEDIRTAIVQGALEHMFENKRWWYFFKDWKENPSLAQAYYDAVDYGNWYAGRHNN